MTTITRLSVEVDPTARNLRTSAAVLESLPVSFQRSGEGVADVFIADGAPGWERRCLAAIEAGCRAVLVTEPEGLTPPDLHALDEAAEKRNVLVRLARGWSSNALTAQFSAAARAWDYSAVLVESVALVPAPADFSLVLRDQLGLIRAALGGTLVLDTRRATINGYTVVGRHTSHDGSRPLLLSGIASSAIPANASLRVLALAGRLSLQVFHGDSARPGSAVLGGPEGELHLPSIYEDSYRTAWISLHRALASGEAVSTDLADLATDVAAL